MKTLKAGIMASLSILFSGGCIYYSLNKPSHIDEKPVLDSANTHHISYMIKPGDNLTHISKMHNTSIEDILKANPDIKDKDKIYAGQSININRRPFSDSPDGFRYKNTVEAIVTCYTPTGKGLMVGDKKEFMDGITSTGKDAFVLDGIAVDPSLIPYGSKVFIPGFGIKVADDTGSRMRADGDRGIYHIDIRVDDYDTAIQFGKRSLLIDIYDKKDSPSSLALLKRSNSVITD